MRVMPTHWLQIHSSVFFFFSQIFKCPLDLCQVKMFYMEWVCGCYSISIIENIILRNFQSENSNVLYLSQWEKQWADISFWSLSAL